jgi:hypothetical protein
MATRDELERRVDELSAEVTRLRAGQARRGRGVRYRSALALGNLPLVSVALGPDWSAGEARGHAKGVLAIGDLATGFVALGGLARGFVAFGGAAFGLLTLGGFSLGLLLAVGGLAVGGGALGGATLGGVAVGGAAVGYYSCGGAALGPHPIGPLSSDPEAAQFFEDHGLRGLCPVLALPRRR